MSETIAATSKFQEIIDKIESLPHDDQELLLRIIKNHIICQKRHKLLKQIEESLEAYHKGEVRRGMAVDLIKVLENERYIF